LGRSWNERGTYGNILKDLIKKQLANYEKENDTIKKTKIAQNLGYLCQVQTSLITTEDKFEERIEKLEKMVLSAQKQVLAN